MVLLHASKTATSSMLGFGAQNPAFSYIYYVKDVCGLGAC